MGISKLILGTLVCGLWIAACTTSSNDGAGLTTQENAIVGVWVGAIGSAEVTLNINSDKTFKNVTTNLSKILAVREGTWSVEGDKVINTGTKCQMADNAGTLQPAACVIPTDTADINITGNKWTLSSSGTNHLSVVFTKQ
ncbi:MAG: hypothetical protein JWO30_3443 [Fibrobacteres bacterium]|nr:hypothetical protein [Fibrobacterota bacterium]